MVRRISVSPPARKLVASVRSGLEAHVERMRSARNGPAQLRISQSRADAWSDASLASSRHSRSPGAGTFSTAPGHSLAGYERWRQMRELTADVSPTYVGGGTSAPEHPRGEGWRSTKAGLPRSPQASSRASPPASPATSFQALAQLGDEREAKARCASDASTAPSTPSLSDRDAAQGQA